MGVDMDTKFYKIVNGNELSDFDIGFRLENENKKRKENMYKVVSFVLSTILSIFISLNVLDSGDDGDNKINDNISGTTIKEYFFMVLVVLVGAFLISILLFGVYILTDYIYKSFFPEIKENERKEIVDIFYRKIHNQIIAAYSLTMRAIELDSELCKKSNKKKQKVKEQPISKPDVTYQRDLINMYLSKALYYFDQVQKELDKIGKYYPKGSKCDEIIKEIGIDRYEDVNNTAIHGLEKIINYKFSDKNVLDREPYRKKYDKPYEDYINKATSLYYSYKNNSLYIQLATIGKTSAVKGISEGYKNDTKFNRVSEREAKANKKWENKRSKLRQKWRNARGK